MARVCARRALRSSVDARAGQGMLSRRMKLLTFLARRFAWTPHVASAAAGAEEPLAGAADECVVVFVHAERADEEPGRRASSVRQAVKHVQWLARKREMTRCVLHSFTHLGGTTSDPAFARAWIEEVGARLAAKGFAVAHTPFGHSCAWQLDVHGEPLAKVWKSIPSGEDGGEDPGAA
jgi:hypothetical protein